MLDIKQRVENWDENRKDEPLGEFSWVRASGIPYFCAREEVLAVQEDRVREDPIDPGLNLTFLHGTSLHWGVQNILLADLDVIYGKWRCLTCGEMHGGAGRVREELDDLRDAASTRSLTDEERTRWDQIMSDQLDPENMILCPDECSVCGRDEFEYVEQWIADLDHRVGGHPDGFLKDPTRDNFGLLEAKSINHRGAYNVKDRPKYKHLIQLHTYFHLTGARWAKVLYWDKGGWGKKALIEHTVERDDTMVVEILDQLDSMRSSLRQHSAGQSDLTLPERICNHSKCKRAKECPMSNECFSTGNPA